MSLEAALAEHTAALQANTAILERVVAGQAAAMERLAEGKPATTRKPAEKKPEAAAAEPEKKPETPAPSTTATVLPKDADEVKTYISAWTGGTDNADERAKRVELLKAMAAHFGVEPKFPALLPHIKQAVFFIERAKAGKSVDFNAEYDFDGDPAQDGGAPAASDDDFG